MPEGLGRFIVLDENCRIWQFQPGNRWQLTLGSLGVSDYSWWDLAQGFLHFYNDIHHHHHHHRYYYIIISLLLGKEKDFQHSSRQHYEGAHHLLFL